MKYLIEDTEVYTLGEINDYLNDQLMLTSLNKDEIIIDDRLKLKLGMVELERVFDENGMSDFYELGLGVIHLKLTGHTIEIADNEIQSRFENAYECILNGCKGI